MSEQMRSEFEAECRKLTSVAMSRVGDGYADWYVQAFWIIWQASRAALCVELPAKLYGYSGQPQEDRLIDADRNFVIDQCAKAIHAAGVKTK